MNNMPPKLRAECAADAFYTSCARRAALNDHECLPNPLNGRLIEWEHALQHAGRQVQEKSAIVPICWWAHSGPGLRKQINEWIALNRAPDDLLLRLSSRGGRDYFRYRAFLNKKYGEYDTYRNPKSDRPAINYAALGLSF